MLQHDRQGIKPETIVTELGNDEAIRSIFDVYTQNPTLRAVAKDRRILDVIHYILNDEVYIHQSRLNYKPAFTGHPFSWHSDIETWHSEDGIPRIRTLSASLMLSENRAENGPLIVIPGSHKTFIACKGETPDNHFEISLKKQDYGVPSHDSLTKMAKKHGLVSVHAPAGSVLFFDSNLLHASSSNVSPLSRHNAFFCYNSMNNVNGDPFVKIDKPRPPYIAFRGTPEKVTPRVGPIDALVDTSVEDLFEAFLV